MASRTLISFERLPDRRKNTPAERMMLVAPDTKEAMDKLRFTLHNRATRHNITGWVFDIDTAEFHINEGTIAPLIRGQLVLTRPD